MALVTTAWDAKRVELDVVQAYTENALVPNTAFMRSIGREAQTVFPNISARTPKNAADGTASLSILSVTETAAATLSSDLPLKSYEYIPYSNINTSAVNFVSAYTQRLGADLRDAHDKRLINLSIKTAIASGTTVLFDDEGTGSAITGALKDMVVQFDTLKVPQDNRYIFVAPGQLGKVFDQASIRSGDFITGADNSKNLTRCMFLGANVISGVFTFNTDTSADANYAAKYQVNAAGAQPYYGTGWQSGALAVQYFEDLTVRSSEQEAEESMLIIARLQKGTATVRPTNFLAMRGDV